jgi:hypothetical protein
VQSLSAISKDRDSAIGQVRRLLLPAAHTSWFLMPCNAQVELLRAKLEQANNKNDVLRENYEMLDTKLTQVNRRRCDRSHRHQLQ